MKDRIQLKMKSPRGLAGIHIVLIVLIVVLGTAAAVPVFREYKYHADWLACADSLRVVNGAVTVDFIENAGGEARTLSEMENALVAILPGRDSYCPAGGTVYFTKQENGLYKAVCGMHDSDHALRTRLNGSYVLTQLREALRAAQKEEDFPETLEVELNGRTLTCRLVEEETGIRRGTSSTRGYSGTVAFYGIRGRGTFENNAVREKEICYFSFADEDHNATWRAGQGWMGSAYGDRY